MDRDRWEMTDMPGIYEMRRDYDFADRYDHVSVKAQILWALVYVATMVACCVLVCGCQATADTEVSPIVAARMEAQVAPVIKAVVGLSSQLHEQQQTISQVSGKVNIGDTWTSRLATLGQMFVMGVLAYLLTRPIRRKVFPEKGVHKAGKSG